jgi:CubicO group peptidase (beta-lactamase class C family)
MDKVKTVPAKRKITIRDLLSHSSGLQQGVVGYVAMFKDKHHRESLESEAEMYSKHVLGFQPGTAASYSPIAGFDMLARIIEIATNKNASDYLKNEVFEPLEMKDTTFRLSDELKERLVSVYRRQKGKLNDVTNTRKDVDGVIRGSESFVSGAGGLYSTALDYERFVRMLVNGGRYNGIEYLKPETIKLMHTEAATTHIEMSRGFVWGLGVIIRQDPVRGRSFATEGTYGWSGAFGTHFFISPKDNLSCVWLVNRSDLNGAFSYISKKVEKLVFGVFAN